MVSTVLDPALSADPEESKGFAFGGQVVFLEQAFIAEALLSHAIWM